MRARTSHQPHRNAPSAQASCAAAARHCLRPAKKAARRPFCRRQAARLRAKCARTCRITACASHQTHRNAPSAQASCAAAARRCLRPAEKPHAALFASARLRACVRSAPRACRSVARAGHQPHRRAASAQASCAAAARHCLRPAKRPHAALFAGARLRACVRSAPRACRIIARAGHQPHQTRLQRERRAPPSPVRKEWRALLTRALCA